MADLVTCKYCGVVERGHRCEHRPKRKNIKNRESDRFRSSAVWKKKAEECKQRDRYLCRVCVAGLYNTLNQINYKNLEAHHIIPIAEDYNKRLDNDNIITLCQMHHKMAERGEIPREVLFEILASPPEYNVQNKNCKYRPHIQPQYTQIVFLHRFFGKYTPKGYKWNTGNSICSVLHSCFKCERFDSSSTVQGK